MYLFLRVVGNYGSESVGNNRSEIVGIYGSAIVGNYGVEIAPSMFSNGGYFGPPLVLGWDRVNISEVSVFINSGRFIFSLQSGCHIRYKNCAIHNDCKTQKYQTYANTGTDRHDDEDPGNAEADR